MPEDNMLLVDQERRLMQHEAVHDAARQEVQLAARQGVGTLDQADRAKVATLSAELKHQAIDEVKETEININRARTGARLSQFIDFAFYLIYGLITLQIVFDLFGARRTNGMRSLIDTLTAPLLAPFNNLFPDLSAGRFNFRFSYVAALVIYLLLHLVITAAIRLVVHRKTEV